MYKRELGLYIRGWNGIVSDVWRPYLGREPQLHLFLTSHGTPCTCCGCRSGSRIGSRYRSSWPSMDVSRGSSLIRKVTKNTPTEYIQRSSWQSLRSPSWPFATSSRSTRNETLQPRCLAQKFSYGTTLALGLPPMASGGQWPGILWGDLITQVSCKPFIN